ncbi:MAG: sulfatase-like hydrolase/transferase [Phycisphaerae bacterium]
MNRRDFLRTASGAALGAVATGCTAAWPRTARAAGAPRKRPPNVVLVITDDQGYYDLSCHGNPVLKTPNLDRLHAESTHLADFHVDPTCAPTRSALMTARYSSRVGVWHTIIGRHFLAEDETTMADVFAGAGYATAIFGKWHLGDNYPFRPQDRGFQEVLIHGGGGVGQGPDYWGNDYFDDTYFHNGTPEKYDGYCTDVWFGEALKWIASHRDRPFFCYLSTNAPHGPYNVAEKYWKPFVERGVKEGRARFYGMIVNIDENMGRLRVRLRQLGLAENTILLFITDNGTSAGMQGPMRGRKGSEYDGGHRVPCFIHWPAGLKARGDVDALTAHVDILPTLTDLCGLPPPEGVAFDGMSLAPLLRGEGEWPDRTLFVHSQRIDHPKKWRKCAVMTDRWRLVSGKQLFDMPADPGQKTDVAGEHPEVVERLRAAYEAWWQDIDERFDEYCRIGLGSDEENPSHLVAHDWHPTDGPCPWSQSHVRRKDLYANGWWAVRIARPGTYRITLRRAPKQADMALDADEARLKIGEVDETKQTEPSAKAVTFEVDLAAGPARLQTWLANSETGKTRGAYDLTVERV